MGVLNFGVDFESRNSRLSGSVEYFDKRSKYLLAPQALDPTLGTGYLNTNSANMIGHGIDLVLNSLNIAGENFRWRTNLLLSSVKNKITKYLSDQYTTGYTSDGQYINPLPGYQPYLVVSYKWAGLDSSGNPQGYVNGKPSTDYDAIANTPLQEQAIGGAAVPRFFGSVINTFEWKGISVSANILYRLGYYFRRPSLNYFSLFKNGMGNAEYSKRWQQPGDELTTNVPALVYPVNSSRKNFYQYSDINVEKADHLRLTDVRVSYEFPSPVFRKSFVQHLQVYAYLSNLNVLLWKANKEGVDPEFPTRLKTPVSASFGIKTDF